MKIKSQPYQLLIPIFVFILVLSFLKSQHASFDIHLHDAYLVIVVRFILLIFAIFTIVIWGIYSVTDKVLLSRTITWVHVVVTIITVVTLVSIIFWNGILFGLRTSNRDWSDFDEFAQFSEFVGITAAILLFSQLLYIINLVLGLLIKPAYKKPTQP